MAARQDETTQSTDERRERKPSPLSAYMGRFLLWFLAFAATFIGLTAWHTWRNTHTHVIVYQLVPRVGQALLPDDAQRAAEILVARARALEDRLQINHASARPLKDGRLELTFRSPRQGDELLWSLTWLTLQGHIEFRLARPARELTPEEVEDTPVAGTEIKYFYDQRFRLNYPGDTVTTARPYRVLVDPVLECNGFVEMEMETLGLDKLVVVTMRLAPEHHDRFATQTALNVGRTMVMLVDGEMLLPPREIGERIGDGKMVVSGYLQLAPVRRLVAILQAGALPAPVQMISHTVDGRQATDRALIPAPQDTSATLNQ